MTPWRYPLRLVWGIYGILAAPLLGAAGALIALFGILRKRCRLTAGRCPACGYDLRGTPERCPECGAVPSVKEARLPGPGE